MKAEELEDLQVYSDVLSGNINAISVLSAILESQIRDTKKYVKFFKEHVDENALKNARKNH